MRLLLLTTQREFLGEPADDSVLSVYQQYAVALDKLDVIVVSPRGYNTQKITDNFFVYPTNSFCFLSHYSSVKRILNQLAALQSYDLIIAHDPFLVAWLGYLIKNRFGGRLIINIEEDFWHNPYWRPRSWYRYFLLKWAWFNLRRADALQVTAQGLKNKLIHYGIKADQIKVNPFFVDEKRFSQPDNQTVMSIQREFEGRKIVLWTGKFEPQSNPGFIFKILGQLSKNVPEVIILMVTVGKFFKRQPFANLANKYKAYLKIINLTNSFELINYFHAADLIIQTSVLDGTGLNLWRAAAAAKPVVSSATAGAKQAVIDGQTGYLVPVNNQRQFIQQLSKLLKNGQLRAQFGEAAYQRFQRQFSGLNAIQQALNNWQGIIEAD